MAARVGEAGYVLVHGEAPFDIAVAVQVGAFDGRQPQAGRRFRDLFIVVFDDGFRKPRPDIGFAPAPCGPRPRG